MKYKKEVRTSNLIVRLRADDIIETVHLEGWVGPEMVEHAKENVAAVQSITEGSYSCLLTHLTDEKISDEAQVYYSQQNANIVAIALITKNMIQAVLGNIFISIRKLSAPTKLFSNQEDATAWLYEKNRDTENRRKFKEVG